MNSPTVLVLRPLGLGDFLTGIPAYRGIARAFPNHRRILAAPRALAELVPLARAFSSTIDVQPLAPLPDIGPVEVAIDLHGRGPASQHVLLATRPTRLVSFENAAVSETRGGARWEPHEHEVRRWGRMLRAAGISVDDSDLSIESPHRPRARSFKGALAIHPGAASEARRWPVERYAAIARTFHARGHRIVVTGDRSDAARAHELAALAGVPETDVVAGRTSLLELAAIVGAARALLCGDTGIAHLATALGTPSVVLFGPIPPSEWGPPADRAQHRALWAGSLGNPHARIVDAGLLQLSVRTVTDELENLMVARRAVSAPPSAEATA
ncbi:MAG: glycosyltransferase family 9 protein [Vulcanimicrobiaceae bacterium]